MPFTVSCTACNTRFLLSDDLFRRKVAGNVVTVKCRNCRVEISVDAREPATKPRHVAPRRAPAPPRPKDKMALIAPQPAAAVAATATSTPHPDNNESIWDTDQTVSIIPRAGSMPELVDFEEIPPTSTSDAPPLNTLTHEPGLVHPPRAKKKTDDFLVNLSAGTGGILGAPMIDVSNLTNAALPEDISNLTNAALPEVDAFEIDAERPEPPEPSTQRARMGTLPLFDMSAVLPAAEPQTEPKPNTPSTEPMHIDFGPAHADEPSSVGKVRARKYVVAPETSDAGGPAQAPAAEKKAKRGGVFVWLGVAAVAAAVLVFVGLRGRRAARQVVTEPAVTASAVTASVPEPTSASAEPAETASAAPSTAPAVNAAPTSAVKKIPTQKTEASEATKPEVTPVAVPAVEEKPAEAAPIVTATRQAVEPAAPGTEFDKSAAISALKSAAAQASSCRKDGDPSGTAVLTITFAESGRVTSATIQGPPFAGTATGGCIANTMRHASIPAFDGDRVTVTKTVVIE
jgi:cytoskeletal protein RodZ